MEHELEWRRAAEDGEAYQGIRRGWCLGGAAFREELLARAQTRAGADRVAKLNMKPEEQNEFNLECGDPCMATAPDGQSLYFMADFNTLVQTDMAGNWMASHYVGGTTEREDIEVIVP